MQLAHARIVSHDVLRLAEFYRAVTGQAPVGSEEYVEFRGDSLRLAISSQAAMNLFGAGATCPASNRSVVLEFQVDDVDRERARLEPIVSEWVLQPTNQPWGTRSMLFRDPDGNLVSFFSRVRAGRGARCCGLETSS
jgi:catechol 2,3-dioxygenase-like lactoylglutathione lyase family enzyme